MPGEELIGQFANLAANMAMNGWNNRAAERLAGQANQWNIEQWNRQNQYNLPENQLARLRAAGINPALAMAGGASSMLSGQIADPIHPANVPQITPPPYNSIDPLTLSQADLANSQAEKNRAESKAILEQLPEQIKNIQEQTNQLKKSQDVMNEQINELRARTSNYNEDTILKMAERAHYKFMENLDTSKFDQVLNEWETQKRVLISSIGLNNANAKKALSDAALNHRTLQEMAQTFYQRLFGMYMNNRLSASQVQLNEARFNLLGFDLRKMQAQSWTTPWGILTDEQTPKVQKAIIGFGMLGREVMNYILEPVIGVRPNFNLGDKNYFGDYIAN